MGSAGCETPLVQDENLIRVHHRGNTLRDDELGHMGQLRAEGPADGGVRGGVHSAGGIVQNHDLWLLQKSAGNTEPLLLASRKVAAALSDLGFIAVREGADEAVRLGDPADLLQLLISRLFISPAQIFCHGSRKKRIFLKHHGHALPQFIQRKLLHIDTVHQHLPGVRIVQTGDQGYKRAFSRSGGADDADKFSRLYFHADIIQHRRANILKVTEGHVPEFDAALLHAVLPPGGSIIADIRPGVHHLAEPAV